MPIDTHPKHKGPTSDQVVAEQRRQATILAEQRRQAAAQKQQAAASVPAKVTPAVPATNAVDTRTPRQRYFDEVAPTSIVGRLIKFSKDGVFVTSDDDQPVDVNADFYALADETQIGWIKYGREEGEEPQRIAGLLYDNFVLPPRASLGDLDESEWPVGLDGSTPEDPWKHFQNLVLEHVGTRELSTFSTASKTGRRAVINLCRHYDRLQRTHPGDVPIVRLRPGGFVHKDARIGWVPTPTFCVVGHAPRNSATTPDTTPSGDMGDEIPI
jgi:hypothetical protein